MAGAAGQNFSGHRRRVVTPVIALVWTLVTGLAGSPAVAADRDPFPRPPELEPDVRFWTRVFTEVDTHAGFVHDNRRLDVVYETLRFDPDMTAEEEQGRIGEAVERYRAALLALADGQRGELTTAQARALAVWGVDTDAGALRAAADRVRFQRGQADKFRDGYVRSGRWRSHILDTLLSLGLPAELAALPHVESSFNPSARSHAGAAGLWQFTVPTGKQFLRIDRYTDERLDPFRATEAAARLLARNHELTGSWPLALTAYNHGPGGVLKAVRAMGTDDIATIVRGYDGPAFGFASRNFYVSFLAALAVDRQADAYFGPLRRAAPESASAVVTRPAASAGGARATTRAKSATRVKATRRVKAASAKAERREHRVRRGETLSTIAARYGVSHRQLMALNGLRHPGLLQAGQVLRVPVGDS